MEPMEKYFFVPIAIGIMFMGLGILAIIIKELLK